MKYSSKMTALLWGLCCASILIGCASSSTEPRVREGRQPDLDAFGASPGPRQIERRALPSGSVGSLVQVSRDNTFATISVPTTLDADVDFLVVEGAEGNTTAVLGTTKRFDSERLISVFVLEGAPRIGDYVREPNTQEITNFTEAFAEELVILRSN